MFDKIIKIYSYLYSKLNNYQGFILKPTDSQKKQIDNFIVSIGEKSDNWIFDFLLFQFYRYHDIETKFGKGIIQLNWVIGNKALIKWQKASKEELYYVDLFRRERGLKNPLIVPMKHRLSDSYYDNIRDKGDLFVCKDLSLFDKEKCLVCKNFNICEKL